MNEEAANPESELAFDETTTAMLNALEDALHALGERAETVPQWEFCEGFLTAMLCMRDEPPQDEWLPVLLGGDPDDPDTPDAPFASAGERTRFLMNWLARAAQLRTALEADIENLDDPRALQPAMLDWRGMLFALPEDQRAEDAGPGVAAMPAYGRLWALGFLGATGVWAQDWAPPRDKELAADMAEALACIQALTADDLAPPAFNLADEKAAPSVSQQRMEMLADALGAVYDLFDIARALGPRVLPVRHGDKVGRNDPCPCGSGKKYKKCCGAEL